MTGAYIAIAATVGISALVIAFAWLEIEILEWRERRNKK